MASCSDAVDANCVRYRLFSPRLMDEGLHTNTHLSQCQSYQNELLLHISHLIAAYPWYNGSFKLHLISAAQSPFAVNHLEGLVHFDECIEDEWFIVYLLYEISKYDPQLVIQLQDSDGDLLLIETAEHLPSWVRPDRMHNRHFIFRAALHIIPRANFSSTIQNSQLREVLIFLWESNKEAADEETYKNQSSITQQSNEAQEQIRKRFARYPERIQELMHKTRVLLPVKAAHVLTVGGQQIISQAVRAFNSHDALDKQACRLMRHFPPEHFLPINLRLTRFAYAQLISQKFLPDKRLGWPMPPEQKPEHRHSDIGFKLCCGLEMLACLHKSSCQADSQKASDKPKSDISLPILVETDQRWASFLSKLNKIGYFQELLEGSAEHNKRLMNAKDFFLSCTQPPDANDSDDVMSLNYVRQDVAAASQINSILAYINESDVNELRENYNKHLSDEESDQWLFDLPDHFLEMESKQQSLAQQTSQIPNKLDSFIKFKSDHKGVIIPKEQQKPKKLSLKERALDMISSDLRSILTMKVSDSDSLSSESDMSDYNDDSSESEIDELKHKQLKLPDSGKAAKASKLPKVQLPINQDTSSSSDEDEHSTRTNRAKRKMKPKLENTSSDHHEDKFDMCKYMQQMDAELSKTCLSQTFETIKKAPLAHEELEDESDSEPDSDGQVKESLHQVDVELNAIKNMLESFQNQNGLSGPAGNLLSSMDLHLPPNGDQESSKN